MGRRMIAVNTALLQQIVDAEEPKQSYGGLMPFFAHVAEKYNESPDAPEKITPSVIYLRYKANQISTNITSQRGQHLRGKKLSTEQKEKLHQGKKQAKLQKGLSAECCEALRKNFPDREKAVERVINGSMIHAIKLFCWQCCGGERELIRTCPSIGCSLYQFRPYQKKSEENPQETVTEFALTV